jgi:hypothetical protein
MKSFPHLLLFITSCVLSFAASAQDDDLMKLLGEEKPQKEFVYNAFKSSRVIMSHSMEMLRPGVLDFRILHRFGNVNRGISEFFGLDQATIRLGLDYGINDRLTVGIGRGSYKKEIDGFIKYRAIHQAKGPKALPFSLLFVGSAMIQTIPFADVSRQNYLTSKMAFSWQAIIGRKFSDQLTLQLMPTVVHRNLVRVKEDPSNVFAAGLGGRIKLSKRISLNVDLYHVFNQEHYYPDTVRANRIKLTMPLSIGFDIETGGHVFQLHFTNAVGMNERVFITETNNNWLKGDIQFGFNISRAFQIRKRK